LYSATGIGDFEKIDEHGSMDVIKQMYHHGRGKGTDNDDQLLETQDRRWLHFLGASAGARGDSWRHGAVFCASDTFTQPYVAYVARRRNLSLEALFQFWGC
jgi:hypothetical protein